MLFLPLVDEADFYAAVDAARHHNGGVADAVALRQPVALRGCAAMLLSVGSRLRGRAGHAEGYLKEAKRCVGVSLMSEPPSQLLISTLLLLTLGATAGAERDADASTYASVAHGLLPVLGSTLRSDIRFDVCSLRHLHSSITRWPSLQVTIGKAWMPLLLSCVKFFLPYHPLCATSARGRPIISFVGGSALHRLPGFSGLRRRQAFQCCESGWCAALR
jgi:hypothetical protein